MQYIQTKRTWILSTKEYDITDDNERKLGICQRYYNSNFQKIFSYIEKRDGYLNYKISTEHEYKIEQDKKGGLLDKTKWSIYKNGEKIGSLQYKFDLSREKMILNILDKEYLLDSSIISNKVLLKEIKDDSNFSLQFYVHDLVYRRMIIDKMIDDWEIYYLAFLVFDNYN
ncbi:tubby C-terminal domain-like protein [Macrococcus carouselicus]|uniref:Tubby C-terminal domain-containing protein n=1 Tax=Macrococcus carouselicus TaxID=69969 RepID=A0A9Q8FPW7_9STAP|nr:hypothetical protein [Macrococcus carouselicus]TDL94320.1 hypothetical protein ERX40_10990 [Macrococcus carouselicus]